ncbi:MAG: T9SS type A sorting domain-containing protein, partial [Bacteroidota bacterium]
CDDDILLNDFDWRTQSYLIDPDNPNDPDSWVGSPFYNDDATKLSYLWNPTAYPLSALDYEPADGWELIRFDPDEDAYVILYNKYTSILRVLFLLPSTQADYDAVMAEIMFDPPAGTGGNVTALFHPTTGENQALDQNSLGALQSYVVYPNEDDIFMHFDIPVEYDPCTCLSGASTLKINFKKINEMELQLYGRYVDIEQNLASIENGAGFLNEDFLTQAYLVENPSDVAGAHIFKYWDIVVNDYKEFMEIEEAFTEKYQFYKVFGEAVGIAQGLGIFDAIKVAKFKLPLVGDVKITGDKLLKIVAGTVKQLGAPLKKKLDEAGKRVDQLGTTSFTHGEMVLNGSLVDDIPLGSGIAFNLPGSAAANECSEGVPQLYPRYNETLGRFALINTPKVHYEFLMPALNYRNIKLRIDPNTLEYALNPAANILEDQTQIWASMQFVFSQDISTPFSDNLTMIEENIPESVWTTPLMPMSCLSEFVAEITSFGNLQFDFQAYLTIAADYFFDGVNSEGETPRAIQFYEYPIELEGVFINDPADQTAPFIFPTPGYTDDLELNTTNFTEDETIFAWGTITISGDLTADDGVQVEIIAPNIVIESDSWIDPDIDLFNATTPFECQPMAPIDEDELIDFCQSDSYRANNAIQQLRAAPETPPETSVAVETPKTVSDVVSINAEVIPNPVGNQAAILSFQIDIAGPTSATIFDLSGKQLQTLFADRWLEEGVHKFNLPTQSLPSGSYLVSLQHAQGTQTVRFVK